MKPTFILLAAMLVLLVACTTPQAQQSDSEDIQTPTDTPESPDEEPTGAEGDSIEEEADSALDELMDIASGMPVEYMVVYELSSQGTDGTMTAYYDAPRARYDMQMEQMTTRTLVTEDAITSCTDRGQGWNCVELGMEQAERSVVDTRVEESEVEQAQTVTADGTMQVAGVTARCFSYASEGSQLRQCFSNEGVLLYSRTETDGDVTVLEATSYDTSVSGDVFVLPPGAESQSIDDMMEDVPSFDPSDLPQY